MPDRLTLQELESYLWGAAIILRGLVDAGGLQAVHLPSPFLQAPLGYVGRRESGFAERNR